MKTKKEFEHELLLKEQRVAYWERFGLVPDINDLVNLNDVDRELGV